VVHVEKARPGPERVESTAHLDDGTLVSAETSTRLSCDAAVVRMAHAPDGGILDIGRRTRTISPALRRALEARDRGCRFPGCGLRFTDAHHVKHWADGGETTLANTLLLCRHHHRLVHEGGWRVMWQDTGLPVFVDPRGGYHYEGGWEWTEAFQGKRPGRVGAEGERPETESTAEALLAKNRLLGVRPDGWTAASRWQREADIPPEVFLPAIEAIGEADPGGGGGP
jgi:hypothetical protein